MQCRGRRDGWRKVHRSLAGQEILAQEFLEAATEDGARLFQKAGFPRFGNYTEQWAHDWANQRGGIASRHATSRRMLPVGLLFTLIFCNAVIRADDMFESRRRTARYGIGRRLTLIEGMPGSIAPRALEQPVSPQFVRNPSRIPPALDSRWTCNPR